VQAVKQVICLDIEFNSVSNALRRALRKSAQASIDRLLTSYYCSDKARKVHFLHESALKRRLTVFVCLTLAVLFLYNPYLAITPSSSVLNVHHSLSYRATVGSSELQHFSPTDARKILALSVATVLSWLDSPANPIVSRVTEISADPARAFELVCSDLWFRPPPAV
jgi:hypothetical protein